MNNKELIQRLVNFGEEETKEVKKEQSKKHDYPHKNEIFDLDKIPMEILDRAWQDYRPYLYAINHNNYLASRVNESIDYKRHIEKVRDAIVKTFPLDIKLFDIREENHKMYASILVAKNNENTKVIENTMEKKGFFRSQPIDNEYDVILKDRKGRPWVYMRFEPKKPGDVTYTVHFKYNVLYHLAPSIFEEKILKKGLTPSNGNSTFKYSEPRVFVIKGDATDEEIQNLVNLLYDQAYEGKKQNPERYKDLTPEYTLFTLDVTKMNYKIRFFKDINEKIGYYTLSKISPKLIIGHRRIKAQDDD